MEMKVTFQYGIGRLLFVTFDDYDIREYGNLWDERYNITTFPRLNYFRGDGYNFYKMVFYSDEFTNFPLSLD